MQWDGMSEREKSALTAECMGIDLADSAGRPIPFPKAYSTDYTAAAQVREEIERRRLEEKYISQLEDIVWSGEYHSYDYPSAYKWALLNATADQQAHAFVRACGRDV